MQGSAINVEVNKEFRDSVDQRFEDVNGDIEANKENLENLQRELNALRNEMLAKFTKDSLNQSSSKIDFKKTQPDIKASNVSDAKIKEIEDKIKNMNIRFQKDIDKLQSIATIGAGSGDDAEGASRKLMEMTVKKIQDKHDAHTKRMNQIDIKIQNALTDI